MDTGSDFIRPEFLNILFFQQKNLVIFPYVDINHLHTLEIFTAGHNVIDLESTALHNLKEIIEFESSNSYAQNPTLFFISNAGKKQLQQIMGLERIRCIINSNEDIGDLANGSKFIFFNKKHSQFINYEIDDKKLAFEKELISESEDEELLQEQIQKIKIAASRIFREINENDNLQNLPKILSDYKKDYWKSILTFTRNYYDINIPDISTLNLKDSPQKVLKDFSDEYEVLVSTNKAIGKEFIQILHDHRSKKVNPQHLDLLELFSPQKLYTYLRNHHWKGGIPQDFVSAWVRMELSGYSLTESDQEDFDLIIEKLGLPQHSIPLPPSQQCLSVEKVPIKIDIHDTIPSLYTDWNQFKEWMVSKVDNLESIINNSTQSELTSIIFSELSGLNRMLNPYRKKGTNGLKPQINHAMSNQKQKIPHVDITNPTLSPYRKRKINELQPQENYEKINQNQRQKILHVDTTNILNLDKDKNRNIKVSNIAKVRDAVLALGYIPKMWADASMRHHVDNEKQYEQLIDKKIIYETPAGTKADIWVLKIAKKKNYKFLTNDLYRKYREEFGKKWIAMNRLTCVHDEGEFIILENS